MENFSKAIEANPKHAEAYFQRGTIFGSVRNDREAIQDYNEAIKINLEYAEAFYRRGISYDRLGNHVQAAQDKAMARRLGYRSL